MNTKNWNISTCSHKCLSFNKLQNWCKLPLRTTRYFDGELAQWVVRIKNGEFQCLAEWYFVDKTINTIKSCCCKRFSYHKKEVANHWAQQTKLLKRRWCEKWPCFRFSTVRSYLQINYKASLAFIQLYCCLNTSYYYYSIRIPYL